MQRPQDRYQHLSTHESPSAAWGLLDGSPQLPQQQHQRVSDAPGVPRRNLFAPNMGEAVSPAGIELSPVQGGDMGRHDGARYDPGFRGSPASTQQQQVVYPTMASNPFQHQHVQEVPSKVAEQPWAAKPDHSASSLPVTSIENKDDASTFLSHQVRIRRIQKMAQDTGMDLFLVWLSHLLLSASLLFLLSATEANGVSMNLDHNHFGEGQPQVLSGPFFYTFLPIAFLVALCMVETMAFFKFSLDHGVLIASYVYSNRSGLFCVAVSGNFFVALSLILLHFYLSRFPCCDFLAPVHLGVFYVMLPVAIGIVLFVCWCTVWLMRGGQGNVEQSLRADLFPTPGRVRILVPCLFFFITAILILLKAEGWVDILWISVTTPLLAVFAFWVGDGTMTAYRYDSKDPRSLQSHRNLAIVAVLDGACLIAVVATTASAVDHPSWNAWQQGLLIPPIFLFVAYSLWMLAELYLRCSSRGPEDKWGGGPNWLDPRIETMVQTEPGTSCSICGSDSLTYAAKVVWACPAQVDRGHSFVRFVLQLALIPRNTQRNDGDGKLGQNESVKVEGENLDWEQVYAGSHASITLRQLRAGCSYAVRVRGEKQDQTAPDASSTGALGVIHPPASHAALHVHAPMQRTRDTSPPLNQNSMAVEPSVALAPAMHGDTQNSARVSALEDVVWHLRNHNHLLGSELADMRRYMESNNLPRSQSQKYWEQIYNQREENFRIQEGENGGGVGLAETPAQAALKPLAWVRWARMVDLLTIATLRRECKVRVAENVGLHMCLKSAEQWGMQQSRHESATVEAAEASGPRLGESLLNLAAPEEDEASVPKPRVLSFMYASGASRNDAVRPPQFGSPARSQWGGGDAILAHRDKAPLLPFSQGLESSVAAIDATRLQLDQTREMENSAAGVFDVARPRGTPQIGAAMAQLDLSPPSSFMDASGVSRIDGGYFSPQGKPPLPPQGGQDVVRSPQFGSPAVSQSGTRDNILAHRDKAPLLPFSRGLENSVAAADATRLQLDQAREMENSAAGVFDVARPRGTPQIGAAMAQLDFPPSSSFMDASGVSRIDGVGFSPRQKPPLPPQGGQDIVRSPQFGSPAVSQSGTRDNILAHRDKAPLLPFSQGLESSVAAVDATRLQLDQAREMENSAAGVFDVARPRGTPQVGAAMAQLDLSPPSSVPVAASSPLANDRAPDRSVSPPPTTAERIAARWERLVDHITIALLRKENRDRQTENVSLHLCLKSAELYQNQSLGLDTSPQNDRPPTSRSIPPSASPAPTTTTTTTSLAEKASPEAANLSSIAKATKSTLTAPVGTRVLTPNRSTLKAPVDTRLLTPRYKAPLPGGSGVEPCEAGGSAPSTPKPEEAVASIVVETTPQLQVFLPGHPSPLQDLEPEGSDAAKMALDSELEATIGGVLSELVGSVADLVAAAKPEEQAAAAAQQKPAATPADDNGGGAREDEEPSIQGPFLDQDPAPEPAPQAQIFTGTNLQDGIRTVSTDNGYLWDVAMGSNEVGPMYQEASRSAVPQGRLHGMFRTLGRSNRPPTGEGEPRSVWTLRNQSEEGGIGLLLEERDGKVTVKRLVEGGSAERDGRLRVGDEVVLVDGKAVERQGLKAIFDMIKGQPGTQVTVTVRRQHASRVSAGTPFLPGMGLYVPPFGEAPRSPATFSAHIVTIDRQPMLRAHT